MLKTSSRFKMKYVFVLLCLCLAGENGWADDLHVVTQQFWEFFPLKSDYLQFSIMANKDAYITLSRHAVFKNPYYKFVLGGWGNTRSALLRPNEEEVLGKDGITLSQNSYDSFTIIIDKHEGSITLGDGFNQSLLYYKDPHFMQMSYFGIATSANNVGKWVFDFDSFHCICDAQAAAEC